jgi:hypothetical protein
VAEIALSNQSFFLITSCCRKALGMKRFKVALATGFGLTVRVLGCYVDIIAHLYQCNVHKLLFNDSRQKSLCRFPCVLVIFLFHFPVDVGMHALGRRTTASFRLPQGTVGKPSRVKPKFWAAAGSKGCSKKGAAS